MLIVALQHSGLDPPFAVGGDLGEAGTNAHHGSGECFVAEADESDGSLLEYTPTSRWSPTSTPTTSTSSAAARPTPPFSTPSSNGWPRVARWWCAGRPGGGARRTQCGTGVRVLRYGSGPASGSGAPPAGGAGRLGTAGHRRGGPRPTGLRAASTGDATGGARTAHGAQRAGARLAAVEGHRRRSTTYWTGWPASRASAVASNWSGPPTGAGLRRLRASPDRGQGGADRATHRRRAGRRRSPKSPHGGRSIVVFQPHLYSRTKTFAREFGAALDNADEVFVPRRLRRQGSRCPGERGIGGRTRQRAGALRRRLLRRRRPGRRGGPPRRRGGDDGRRRRDDAGPGDHRGVARQGESVAPGTGG